MKGLIIVSLFFGLSTGCAKRQAATLDLQEQQGKIVRCSTDYIECLNRTRVFKGSFDRFEAEVDKCVVSANKCP